MDSFFGNQNLCDALAIMWTETAPLSEPRSTTHELSSLELQSLFDWPLYASPYEVPTMDWSQPSFQPISPGPFEISSPENTFNQSLSYSSPEQHSAAHGVWPSFTDSPNSSSQLASPPLQCSHTSYRESPQHCYIMCNNFLSPDQVHQRALLQHCLQSRWLNADELEPSDAPRRSILLGFLAQNTPKAAFSCEFDGCGKKFDRQDRALGHIRMHLCHRPYACNLQCGNSSCVERFSCRSYLQSHLTRQKEKCRKCGQSFLRQNMRRHNGTCPGSSLL